MTKQIDKLEVLSRLFCNYFHTAQDFEIEAEDLIIYTVAALADYTGTKNNKKKHFLKALAVGVAVSERYGHGEKK